MVYFICPLFCFSFYHLFLSLDLLYITFLITQITPPPTLIILLVVFSASLLSFRCQLVCIFAVCSWCFPAVFLSGFPATCR